MVKATLYTQEIIDEYMRKKLWELTLPCDLCDRDAKDYPNDEAVVDAKSRLTWAQLKQQSDRIALGLLELGLKKDDVILAQLHNCTQLYVLLVACQKAGVILATAQPTFRQAELQPILRHIKAKAVVIPWKFRDYDYFGMFMEIRPELPELQYIIVIGDAVPEGALSFSQMTKNNLEGKYPADYLQKTKFRPHEVANIVTTSGTTGIPKCVEWTICSRMATGRVWAKRIELTHSDVIGACYNIIGGGLSTLAQCSMPIVGAKLALLEHFTPQGFCELVQKERVTIAAIVPAEMSRLLDYPDLNKYDLSSLRLLHNSTALLPYQLGVTAEERLRCRYVQTYGAMDCGSITSTSIHDSPEVRLGTVGQPYDGGEVKVVDDEGNALPPGEIGEVLVKQGPYSAGGYYGNIELTRKCWQSGWYDVEEKGKVDKDGNLSLVGRKRDIIIRGGQNIYPKEIEDLLIQHPKVSDVAIVGMPDRVMGQKLCAYIVPKHGQQITFEEMVAFLKSKKLAPFKLLERLEVLAELPLVPAGQKVDRKHLEQDIAYKLQQENP